MIIQKTMRGLVLGSTVCCALLVSCADQAGVDSSTHSPNVMPTAEVAEVPKLRSAPTSPVQPIKAGEITVVSIDHLFGLMQTDQVLLIDCRPSFFYRMGHIDGAINLPAKKYDSVILSKKPKIDAALKANKVMVLYCQNLKCPDAYKVAKKFSLQGHAVTLYKGGWEEWGKAGF